MAKKITFQNRAKGSRYDKSLMTEAIFGTKGVPGCKVIQLGKIFTGSDGYGGTTKFQLMVVETATHYIPAYQRHEFEKNGKQTRYIVCQDYSKRAIAKV